MWFDITHFMDGSDYLRCRLRGEGKGGRFCGYLRGQLAPSGLLEAVLPSGQQPKGVLSHDERSSAVGMVVAAAVGSGDEMIHNA